jgi:outer membrane protein assembly factor BamB
MGAPHRWMAERRIMTLLLLTVGCRTRLPDAGVGDLAPRDPCPGLQPNAPWPMTGRCAGHSGRSPFSVPASTQTRVLADFSDSLGFASTIETPAIAADGTVYFSAHDERVHAIDPLGRPSWVSSDAGLIGTPAIGATGTLFIGSTNYALYALDPDTGAVRWRHPIPEQISDSPTVGRDGTVYFSADRGRVYALDGSTGGALWVYSMGGPDPAGHTALGPDGALYFGVQNDSSSLIALAAATGAEQWRFDAGERAPTDSESTIPTIGDLGLVYFAASDGTVYAIEVATGAVHWRFANPGGIASAPALGLEGTVYVAGREARGKVTVYALDGGLGTVRWTANLASFGQTGTPTVAADGTVYIGSGNVFHALDGQTGRELWSFDGPNDFEVQAAIGADGTLYAPNLSGKLFAIGQ